MNGDSDIIFYKQLKNKLKHLVHEAKLVYIKELISQSKRILTLLVSCGEVLMMLFLSAIRCKILCCIR